MKLRFLAAAGPADLRQRLATRLARRPDEELIDVPSAASMSLWVEAGTPVVTNDTKSAIAVGLLFDRNAHTRVTSLPGVDNVERICMRDLWGAYVLFATEGGSHSAIRDPSGSIPVYYGMAAGLQLYASDADMLRLAWPEPFRPNLDAVRHWLRFPFLRTARTGALRVTELLPGMVREVRGDRERLRSAWSPNSFLTRESRINSIADAAPALRADILNSVRVLAEGQPKIVLQLSGGLDSSILAAALSHAGIAYRAITFATRSSDGDERRYAREVAAALGVQLDEFTEADVDLSVRIASGPLRRPPNPVLQALRSSQLAAAGRDALLLDGSGGDNVFASINSASPVIDALRMNGVADCARTVRNVAARHGVTVWAAAASALRRARHGKPDVWKADPSFLASPTPQLPELHPWLTSLCDMLPGSADHLKMIVGIYDFLSDPGWGEPCNLHPLISQPIVETCLRTSSWLWFEHGRDRSVARAAFREMLPRAVLNRRGKGTLQSMFVNAFAAQRNELRGLLARGRLAESGIIDVGAVTRFLDRVEQPRNGDYFRLLEVASAEQWLRSFG